MEINLIPHNLDKMHFKAGLYQNCFNCDLILLVAYLSFNVWFFCVLGLRQLHVKVLVCHSIYY